MKKKFLIIFAIISYILCVNYIVYADDSNTRSIVGEYFNKVFSIELNDGKNFLETENDYKKRENINEEIYTGRVNKTYSLYDRFGGNIKFIPYFGETKISTGLLDRFYTNFISNDSNFKLSADEILNSLSGSAISNNVIYEGRPNILSSQDIEANNVDPRVYSYAGVSSVGGDAALGNFLLRTSNYVTTIVGVLSGSGLYEDINNIWNKVCSLGLTKLLSGFIKFFLPLSISVFIFILIAKIIKTIKGRESFKKLIQSIISVVISLGLVFSLSSNPLQFSNILTKVISGFDKTLDKSISSINSNSNEVFKSDDSKNIRTAMLWEKNILNPWCNGMFGNDYNKLYTQYDTNSNHKKMKQSNSDVKSSWKGQEIKYDSKSLTGDIKIQIGKNKYIRNWAALAWSTQSIYHIDAVDSEDKKNNDLINDVKEKDERKVWPRATKTPMNDQIFIDNFRWLDAKLNISPEYYSPDNVIMNYSDSNNYEQKFISYGFYSVYMTLLLIPILILTIRKIRNILKIVSSGFILCYTSLINFIMPNKYDIISNLKKTMSPIYDFLWWSIIIFLAITTYYTLCGKNLIGDFVWLLVGYWFCKARPVKTSEQLNVILNKLKSNSKYFYTKLTSKNMN